MTYDNILRLSDDPDVNNVIKFLREREIVHFQRFGEAIQLLREKLNKKNVYAMMAVSVVLFAIFYPALTGRAVGSGYGTNVLKWLSSWPL